MKTKTKKERDSLVGMNINDFLYDYGSQGEIEHFGFFKYFITYRKSTGKIMSVDIKAGKKFDYKKPRLFGCIGGGRIVKGSSKVRVHPFPSSVKNPIL